MNDRALPQIIAAEADRIRTDGSLPPGFEADLRTRFDAIAADPAALEAEVARGRAVESSQAPGAVGQPRSIPRRALAKTARVSRRAASAGKRRFGPSLRSVERRTIESVGRLSEGASTGAQVASDRARRIAAGSLAERGLARASAGGAGTVAGLAAGTNLARPLRLGPGGVLGDEALDRLCVERLGAAGGRRALHAESGDGSLVTRLCALGLDAYGADSRHGAGTNRRGALEALASAPRHSLGAVVLSGVTDRVTPSSARAIARLVSSRLGEGGTVVVLSANPGPLNAADPVSADLSKGRSLHPVTWCHLFTRLGLEDITVHESKDGSAYAVAATRREWPS